MLFDVRFLPNPHWVDELRPFNGLDQPVRDYVLGQDATGAFLDRLGALLEVMVPAFVSEGKHYLTIGVGCTGWSRPLKGRSSSTQCGLGRKRTSNSMSASR